MLLPQSTNLLPKFGSLQSLLQPPLNVYRLSVHVLPPSIFLHPWSISIAARDANTKTRTIAPRDPPPHETDLPHVVFNVPRIYYNHHHRTLRTKSSSSYALPSWRAIKHMRSLAKELPIAQPPARRQVSCSSYFSSFGSLVRLGSHLTPQSPPGSR